MSRSLTYLWMQPNGALWIDPPGLESSSPQSQIEIAVPYTEWSLGQATLARAVHLSAKLSAAVRLIAVHTVPYPLPFGCPAAAHAHLVEQLVDLASACPLTVHAQVVLSRSRQEGFRSALPAEAIVFIGSRRRLWQTAEERLAAILAADGHKVALLHLE
jgi:hypothetical protein